MSATQTPRTRTLPLFGTLQNALPAIKYGAGRNLHLELHFILQSSGFWFTAQQLVKRVFDILAASAGLLMILPLLLAISLLVKLTSEGPILYKSLRIGKNYQPFYMYKFRTMKVNADALREELRKQANLHGNLFKLTNDPRITPIGKFLRAFSLDELPQLLNVIRGEMSLVGPRPLPPDESELFEEPYTIRYQVNPGITGAWQVGGRSSLTFSQLCNLEFSYVMNWNLLVDLGILVKTVPAVLLKKGAC